MNVLVTCAGRRNLLVRYFRESLAGRGLVYAADASAEAPALQEADGAFVVPTIDDPGYFEHLIRICERHGIRVLVSVNDLELPLLARRRGAFLDVGTIPVISPPDVVDDCFDKWKIIARLTAAGLRSPATFISVADARRALAAGELAFPVVVKPRWGTASIGVEYAGSDDELDLAYLAVKQRVLRSALSGVSSHEPERAILIQEQVCGQEYGLDVVNDLEGRYVTTFVKRKLSHSMRADGVGQAITVDHPQLEALGKALGGHLQHVGNLDCDVFVRDGVCYVLDLNPRFGGGYPFSHRAGANLPAALLAWAAGRAPDPDWLTVRAGIKAARYDDIVLIDPPAIVA
jgi:carbamoyl-phosphate synthase large subunit